MARKKDAQYKKDDLIKMIVEMMCEGHPQAKIKKYIMSLDGGYSAVYFYELYKEAKPFLKEALSGIAENRLEFTIAEMEKRYDEAIELGDRRLANDIRKEINKISGLHQQKIDITSNGESIVINYKKPGDTHPPNILN
ncbi:MAG: hypothetical protein GY870_06670 [archaeon]|nr:hypothetical protein [archaeon]